MGCSAGPGSPSGSVCCAEQRRQQRARLAGLDAAATQQSTAKTVPFRGHRWCHGVLDIRGVAQVRIDKWGTLCLSCAQLTQLRILTQLTRLYQYVSTCLPASVWSCTSGPFFLGVDSVGTPRKTVPRHTAAGVRVLRAAVARFWGPLTLQPNFFLGFSPILTYVLIRSATWQ
jgi:hypothetical protein